MASKLISPFILLLSFSIAHAQEKNDEELLVNYHERWCNGSVEFTDGRKVTGRLWYNPKIATLTLDVSGEKQAFLPRTINKFEMYDSATSGYRKFYSLVFKHEGVELEQAYFFEILQEFQSFAILLKPDPLDLYLKGSGPNNSPNQNALRLRQFETVYFLDYSKGLIPYLQEEKISHLESFGPPSIRTRMINRRAFEQLFAPSEYIDIKAFAKANHLKFNRKDDLIKIFAYYGSLDGKKSLQQ